jgi:predicted TIM-barrel fold metal-dependent hydrolase
MEEQGMTDPVVDFPIYDADQHYYEVADTFTRHLDPAYGYAFRWVTAKDTGRTHLLIGDRVQSMISNPTFDPVGRPGALSAYFRGENTEGKDVKQMMGKMTPCLPEYRDRSARVAVLQEQGVRGCFMLPTLALGIEQLLWHDAPALYAVLHAGNAWIDEEWGFARDNRIVAPPVLSLVDPELAEKELQWVIERGTKAIILRPAPVANAAGGRSPGDRLYDRFWSMCEEAGLAVAFHAADSGYSTDVARWGERVQFGTNAGSALAEVLSVHVERPITEMIAAFIAHGVLDRHPGLKLVTIELGSAWVPDLVRRFKTSYGKIPHLFASDPVEAFHEKVWVTPFQEDHISNLLDHMRIDRILFGSDWPHPEGNALPAETVKDLADLEPRDRRRIMSDNLRELMQLA